MKLLSGGTSHLNFQTLAEMRIREARALLKVGEFDGAFYLAGYCVECALKAVIAKNIPEKVMLPKDSITRLHTHDLQRLADFAELSDHLKNAPIGVSASWTAVKDWNEQLRYKTGIDPKVAQDLIEAIDHPRDGIFGWLKQHW